MLVLRILAVIGLMGVFSVSAAEQNTSYWQTDQAQPQVEDNLYFTWLGCHSCLLIEQQVELEGFKKLPLIARADWRAAAKIQLALEMLAVEQTMVTKFKQQIIDQQLDVKNLQAMTDALIELGVDEEALTTQLNARELFEAIQAAEEKAKQYQIQYAPTVVVKGQYATDAKSTGSIVKFAETLELLKQK